MFTDLEHWQIGGTGQLQICTGSRHKYTKEKTLLPLYTLLYVNGGENVLLAKVWDSR